MDRLDFPHGDFAEYETWSDPGLSPVNAVPGGGGAACYAAPEHSDDGCEESSFEKPARGTFLDETITLRDPEGASLVTAVIDLFDSQRELRRKRQLIEVESERLLVSSTLANGLRCQWYRDPPIVAFQRKADGKTYTKRDKPTWLSAQSLSRAVELFDRVGLLRLHASDWKTSSGYVVNDKLLALAQEHGVTEQSLVRCFHRDDLVRLNSPKPKPVFDQIKRTLVRAKAERIYFDSTPETEEWRDRIEAYNEFLSRQDLRATVPIELEAVWVRGLNEDETHTGMRLSRPELFRRAAYRVFNDGDIKQPQFDRGGRLAGPWWMNAPKDVRKCITINGEGTCELDYSACHPRMLYHEKGVKGPKKPYDIPEVAELERRANLEPDHYGSGVKWLTQVLLNGRGRPDLVDVPKDVNVPPGLDINEFAKIIERFHEPIASSFRTGAGLSLMKVESEIALAIVTKAMEKGWTALSVHDSFVVPNSQREELAALMNNEYIERVGSEPVIH